MKARPFSQVDVFTKTALLGNPLAVVHDATGLNAAAMQRFTNWTNLSEATFLAPPTDPAADYSVRIFCPGRELPFAGHPTLGSCHAWLQAGGQPKGAHIVQQCGVGLVRIKREDTPDGVRLSFAAPPLIRSGPLDDADVALLARGLGVRRDDIVAHAWCDNGPNWRGVMLRSAEQVRALKPDAAVLAGLDVGVVGPNTSATTPRGKIGVIAPQASSNEGADDATQFEVRAFFPGNNGMAEDPVTGSLNAGLAQWLIGAGLAPKTYIAAQGTQLGRAGRVFVEHDGSDVWIGGHSITVMHGTVQL
jgi:PhzF family phenazine biosynthesis protein